MRRLGQVSFAFYLIHAIVLTYAGKLLAEAHRPPSTSQGITISLLALTVSLGAAAVMYHWIEIPAVRRWSRPRTPAVPARNAPVPDTAATPLKSTEGD
jgi:peptidoglycan/LPS O-acetylase OafA/YrhL